MRVSIKIISILIVFFAYSSYSNELECVQGPISKTFGGASWNVYACNDNKSIVIVSAPGNPAMPFFFSIVPVDGGYNINGEGTGDKIVTKATYDELIKLTEPQISNLLNEAKNS